jgi:hypothetical protein
MRPPLEPLADPKSAEDPIVRKNGFRRNFLLVLSARRQTNAKGNVEFG